MSLHLTTNIGANQRLEFSIVGDFFRLMQATLPVMVQYYRNGAEIAEAVDVAAGYAERFRNIKFDRVAITNGATLQSIQIAARDGNEVSYDTPPVGNVSITNVNGAFTQQGHSISTTSTQLRAANSSRRYLLIQNRDPSINLYVNLTGGTANTSTGVLIPAGGSYEIAGFCPTGQINAVVGSGTNSFIVTVEG